MKKPTVMLLATLAWTSCVMALPAPHDQISAYIWGLGAGRPGHVGVGFGYGQRDHGIVLDEFPTEQDNYFSYNKEVLQFRLNVVNRGASNERPVYANPQNVQDTGKGERQDITVERILERCYGEKYEEQMIRALSARALQFGGAMNEIAMLAKVNPVNIPVLRPGTPRIPYKVFAARYKIIKDLFPVRGDMLYISGRQQYCETNAFDDLVIRYRTAYGVTPTFQSWVEGACRSNDMNRVSYALMPLGIVVHKAEDYTEEFAHFVNVGDPYGGRDFEEFKAAYHGAKVDAWKMGIDLGVSGGWAQYISALTADEDWAAASAQRLPANTLLFLLLYVSGGGSEEFRSWCESDAIGRMIL